ncbi:DUF4245 family protein [Nocardioides zeae]|uniref:DUF4245 family protein n=1 Tax=Nocardioides zeae TaxID=1457234 RepID=A0A6P0HL64_9ACTN|nr:DUF4245 family protein [Nocardioides zeae]
MSQTSPPAGRPGRYNRSFSGLIVSMVVLILAVLGFVLVRDLARSDPDMPVAEVDYVEAVRAGQDSGFPVVYPPTLPDGWVATSARFPLGPNPEWTLGILVDGDDFVGVKVVRGDSGAVLDRVLGDPYEVDGGIDVPNDDPLLSGDWSAASEGQDEALYTQVEVPVPTAAGEDGETADPGAAPQTDTAVVVVYGTIGEDRLVDFATTLTSEALPAR